MVRDLGARRSPSGPAPESSLRSGSEKATKRVGSSDEGIGSQANPWVLFVLQKEEHH